MNASLPPSSSALLKRLGSGRGDCCTGPHTARQRDGSHSRIGDDAGDGLVVGVDVGEQALRKPGRLIDVLKGIGGAHDVGRMLEQESVAREHDRTRRPNDLPDRQVPGHDSEDRADRQIRHMDLIVSVNRDRFVGEDGRAVLGNPLNRRDGFFDLCTRGADRLAHFGGDDRGQRLRTIAQCRGETVVGGNSLRHRHVPP
jgi:hypothetical protein